jgi:anti-sigma regulatory factor (Ser/Thr protein kinase)
MSTNQVSDDDDSSIPLPADAHAPGIARAFVERHSGDLPAELIDDAMVLVSELVSNAVLHGQPDIRLQVRVRSPGIGVAVSDKGGDLPPEHPARPSPNATSGRGLAIVDTLASEWGVLASTPPPGKVVWFELHAADRS